MSTTVSVTIGTLTINLPVLVGQSDFRRWYKIWMLALRCAGCWSVVNDGADKEIRPVSTKNVDPGELLRLQNEFDQRNYTAHTLILTGVSEELQEVVCSCADEIESARVAMRLLKDRYEHESVASNIQILKTLFELKMEEDELIPDYLTRYEVTFADLLSRYSESSRPEAIALKEFLSVEDVKVSCLLMSLPNSLRDVVEYYLIQDNVEYSVVHNRLMDLHSTRTISKTSTASKYDSTAKDQPQKERSKTKECTWCKKNGNKYKGHVYNRCRKLKAHQINQEIAF